MNHEFSAMTSPDRTLTASIDEHIVGTLQEQNGLWAFQYHPGWLANPQAFALSPHIPPQARTLLDGASARPIQWYFDNLLPEETQRTLLASN